MVNTMAKHSNEVKSYLGAAGRKVGKAQLTKMTKEERRDIASQGAAAKWGKSIYLSSLMKRRPSDADPETSEWVRGVIELSRDLEQSKRQIHRLEKALQVLMKAARLKPGINQ